MTNPIQPLKQIPKASLVKWTLFLLVVYALYDGVYVWADSKRLMLDIADVRGGLVPILVLHIDLPLLIGSVLICLLFGRGQTLAALSIRTRKQLTGMVLGAVVFVVAVYLKEPASSVAVYEILHALVICGLLEELLFRGLFFSWLDASGCGWLAYLLSGLAWGAHYGIRTVVVNGTMTFWAVFPMAIFGAVVGSLAALVYKKSDSLWLVAYLHGTLSLL